nr:MAG TPA: hypothetical protein [Crassvirales sp.]
MKIKNCLCCSTSILHIYYIHNVIHSMYRKIFHLNMI